MSRIRYAVVTGASSGIGAATALLLAENGFHVLAAARRIEKLEQLAQKNPNISTIALDVTDQSSVDLLAAEFAEKILMSSLIAPVVLSMPHQFLNQIQTFGRRLMTSMSLELFGSSRH